MFSTSPPKKFLSNFGLYNNLKTIFGGKQPYFDAKNTNHTSHMLMPKHESNAHYSTVIGIIDRTLSQIRSGFVGGDGQGGGPPTHLKDGNRPFTVAGRGLADTHPGGGRGHSGRGVGADPGTQKK